MAFEDVFSILEEERERQGDERLEEINAIIVTKRRGKYKVLKLFVHKRCKKKWKPIVRCILLLPTSSNNEEYQGKHESEPTYIAIAVDTEPDTIFKLLKDFFVRSLKEGKLQDFL